MFNRKYTKCSNCGNRVSAINYNLYGYFDGKEVYLCRSCTPSANFYKGLRYSVCGKKSLRESILS